MCSPFESFMKNTKRTNFMKLLQKKNRKQKFASCHRHKPESNLTEFEPTINTGSLSTFKCAQLNIYHLPLAKFFTEQNRTKKVKFYLHWISNFKHRVALNTQIEALIWKLEQNQLTKNYFQIIILIFCCCCSCKYKIT